VPSATTNTQVSCANRRKQRRLFGSGGGLPGTIGGAWVGSVVYNRISDRNFQQVVMALLFVSGTVLIWTSW
jgi:uncharacterized membrane protein YfcA